MKTDERYNRLNTMESYGYPVKWDKLKNITGLIAGVGGVGSQTAEIMVRVGIGKLIIIDFDKIEMANLNRLVYRESDVGKYKVKALEEILFEINPNVEIVSYTNDLMAFDFEDDFEKLIKKTDLGFMCLDNIPARQFFNVKCVKQNVPYVDSGLLRSGLGGYVHLVVPKKTACYQCTGFVEVGSTNDVEGEECSASLPTSVSIISSLQTQHAIKYLLDFGSIPDYVSYNALTDVITQIQLKKDPNCYVCNPSS